jgi:hypothetical protein
LAVLTFSTTASAHHEAVPPKFTQRQAVKLHPVFRAKLKAKKISVGRDQLHHGRARDGKIVWRKVRDQTSYYWLRLHPHSNAYLYWYAAQPGIDPPDVWRAVWEADGVPQWKRDFLMCIPKYEGGYGAVVQFGGSPIIEGFPSTWPSGNTVGSWWQDRPGWINGSAPYGFRRAVYGADRWYSSTVHYAHDPVAMARLNEHLTTEYATGGLC